LFKRQALLQNWRELRPYFIFSVILFAASIVVGGAASNSIDFLDKSIESLRKIADSAENADNPERSLFVAIWLNNVYSSLMALYMGILAGLMPLVTLVVNGMLMGYLFHNMAEAGYHIGPMIAKGILPHGIIEIPALLLACAYGILLGFSLIRGLWGSLIGKTDPWAKFSRAIRGSVPAAIGIVLLLLLAAIIESTVTYRLMGA